MKETIIGIFLFALVASFSITISSTTTESNKELEDVDENIEEFARAGSLALFCSHQLTKLGQSTSAKVTKDSFDRLSLAARILPERNADRKSNIRLFGELLALNDAEGFQEKLVNEEFGGCTERFVDEISVYSKDSENFAREWRRSKEHSLFMHLIYKVLSL